MRVITYLTGGLPKQILGGWQASGILVLQGGRPVTAGTTGDLSNTGGSTRPNMIGDPNTGADTTSSFWNASAFALPAANTFGNAGRATLIGPGMRSFDFSMVKNFPIGSDSKRRVQFRGEIFNIFNHPILSNPSTTVNAAGFNTITSTLINTTSRQIQVALKIYF